MSTRAWVAALLSCVAVGTARADVQRIEHADVHAVEYRAADDCYVSWTLSQREPGVAQLRTDCGLDRVLALSDRVMSAIEREPARFAALTTLFIGVAIPEMHARLASLGTKARGWDPARGRANTVGVNSFIQREGRRSGLLQGWDVLFQRHGLSIELASVEQVNVEKAGTLPFFDELRQAGIGARDKVPTSCPMWIRLIHASAKSPAECIDWRSPAELAHPEGVVEEPSAPAEDCIFAREVRCLPPSPVSSAWQLPPFTQCPREAERWSRGNTLGRKPGFSRRETRKHRLNGRATCDPTPGDGDCCYAQYVAPSCL